MARFDYSTQCHLTLKYSRGNDLLRKAHRHSKQCMSSISNRKIYTKFLSPINSINKEKRANENPMKIEM